MDVEERLRRLEERVFGPILGSKDQTIQGKLMTLLCAKPDTPGLMINDPNGRLRAILTVGPEGPSLVMTDESGEAVFTAP